MSDWGAPDVQIWKKEAHKLQQNMFLRLGDQVWDELNRSDTTRLYRKVGFALYSSSESVSQGTNILDYNQEQLEKITLVAGEILRNAKSGRTIHFTFVFVFGKIYEVRFIIPVFKVKGEQNQTLFVDSDCRVYTTWRNYLDYNNLPKCMYCYPRDGLYQGEEGKVLVDFGTSPACDLHNRIFRFLSRPATLVNRVSTIGFKSNWGAPDVQKWKEEARALQQKMFFRLGDQMWNRCVRSDTRILYSNIGSALFSFSGYVPAGDNLVDYNQEQLNKIKPLVDIIMKNAKSGRTIDFAYIFVFGKIRTARFFTPVFKVKGEQNQTLFVDTDCRVYKTWRNYLDLNKLPKCMYCYPHDGLYQAIDNQVLVDFGTSPACDFHNRLYPFFGEAATVVRIVSNISFKSDWGAPDVKIWKEEARALQQNMFLHLGDRVWDEWDKADTTILYRKVGFALYSLPGNVPVENNLIGYDQEQSKNIRLIADKILRNAKSARTIYFACIFIFGKIWNKRFNIPVFKVLGERNQTLFVDSDCRVYKNWQDYLNFNCLPKCMYCYPRDGLYQGDNGQVLVDFGTSPACDLKNRVYSSLDQTATVVSSVSSSLILASLCSVPIATPVLVMAEAAAAGTAAYFFGRNVETLIDRTIHDQSIGLDSPEAQEAWLGIVGSVLAIAHNQMSANITRSTTAGEVVIKALRITYDVLTIGILTVEGLGVLNGFISLVDKADKGTLTLLDVFQFSTSILFFSHSLLNIRTAEKIIQDTQQQVLNHHSDILTASQTEELSLLLEQVQGKTQIHKNAIKIKVIKHINDKRNFYGSLVSSRNNLEGQ